MALISDHRTSLHTALDAIAGLNVYDTPRDRFGTPCAMIVAPEIIEPLTFGPGGWTYVYQIRLYITRTDLDSAIDDLDPYLSSTGATSVLAALNGISNNISVVQVRDIGNFVANDANYLGADVIVEVTTSD